MCKESDSVSKENSCDLKQQKGHKHDMHNIIDSLNVINGLLSVFCVVGIGLSIYSYAIDLRLQADNGYKAMCDISPKISCTRAFKSIYGRGLGIFPQDSIFYQQNCVYGMLFYSLLLTIVNVNGKNAVYFSMVSIVLSNFASLYFAYTLYFVLHTLCVVCLGIYIVNFINLILVHKKYKCILQLEGLLETIKTD